MNNRNAHQKWEYRIHAEDMPESYFCCSGMGLGMGGLCEDMNGHGDDGWELVAMNITEKAGTYSVRAVYKRPKIDPPKPRKPLEFF